MGLDGVELVMAVEEEFGVQISDADAAGMMTPRHVIDHIARLLHSGQGRCTSRAGFYQLRRACINALGIARDQIRPDTQLAALLPAGNIQNAWTQLRDAMLMEPHYWPSLEYPRTVNWLRASVCLFTIIGLTATAFYIYFFAGFFMFFVSLVLAMRFDDWLTGHFAYRRVLLPEELVTVGNLIDELVPRDWTKARRVISQWDRERIAKKVKEIVIEQLGISEQQYHEDARFIEDFGVD